MSEFLGQAFNHSSSNIYGGQDYYDNHSNLLGSSQHNFAGGNDYYDSHGQSIAHSHSNVFGGNDINDNSSHTMVSAHPTSMGDSVFDGNGSYAGHVNNTLSGGQFTDVHGAQTSWQNNIFGGVNIDPLSNTQSISFPPLV